MEVGCCEWPGCNASGRNRIHNEWYCDAHAGPAAARVVGDEEAAWRVFDELRNRFGCTGVLFDRHSAAWALGFDEADELPARV